MGRAVKAEEFQRTKMQVKDQILAASKAIGEDGELEHWQTPKGNFWVQRESRYGLPFHLAEQQLRIYGNQNHWIGLRLVAAAPGRAANQTRDMLGARVGIVRDGGPTLWRRVRSDGSYASANDPRVLVGLGQSTSVSRVRVIWPSGKSEEWSSIAVDRYTTLREGEGT